MKRISLALFISSLAFAQAQSLETVIQQGHELPVVSVAASPDSNFVATGSRDKSAKLWDVHSGREVRSFLGHDQAVNALAFTTDGKKLISGSSDKTVRVWDVVTGKELTNIFVNYRVTDIAVDPHSRFFVAGGYQMEYTGRAFGFDDSVVVIDMKMLKAIKKINANPDKGLGKGTSLAISPNGKWLAIGEDNRKVKVYNTTDWKLTYDFQYHNPESSCGTCISKAVFTPDNKFLIMASKKGPLKKYSLSDGKIVNTLLPEVGNLTGLSLSPDGHTIALSTENELMMINTQTGTEISKVKGQPEGNFNELEFMPNQILLVGTNDNTATLWSRTLQNQKLLTGFLNMRDKGGLSPINLNFWQQSMLKYVRFKNQMIMTNDGKSLIKGKFGSKVKRWDVASGKTIMDFVGHDKAVLCYDLSHDGKRLITGGGDGKIILWNFETGDSLKVIKSYKDPIFDIKFNSDETKVATCGWDALVKIHDIQSQVLEKFMDLETSPVINLIFHPNDQYLFTSRTDNSLQMWEMDTRSVVRSFVGHTDNIASMRLSKDASKLLTAGWDGSIRLWDVGTGLMVKKFSSSKNAVHVAVFNQEETQIFSGGADRVIRVWDVSSSKVVRTFEGHRAEISTLLFSPDNKLLISHSVDGATKFWDMTSGKEFFEHIQLGEKDWMAKNPEGYFHGTENARQFIHFVDGVKTYSVDQFFNDFYRPDLLPKMFQERGSGQKGSLQGKLLNSPPPSVRLALVPNTDPVKVELLMRITDNGGGVDAIKLFHNGKNIPINKTELKLPSGSGKSVTYKHVVNLVGGNNVFSGTAINKDLVESDAHTAELFSETSSKNSVCHLLAVGINQYKNPRMSLNYAKPDAESFLAVMEKKGATLFKNVELHTLYDKDASRENILKKMDELALKVQPEDVFIFYYAGHGSMVDNQFFFIPTESSRLYDISALKTEAIEASLLQEKLKNIKALKQLIIMDACQSGGSVELLATRGASEEKAIAQLSRSAGIHVMASAGSEQFAAEFAELGHGLFTYLLIKALQGDADGAPKDGKVTIYELKSYLDDQVPEMTRKMKGKPQYPYTFSRGHDFPIVVE